MDIPILKYVDVLIGLCVVMIVLSTAVLAVTQIVLNLAQARPRHLRRGLERLILQIEPAVMRPHAGYVAALVLRHPLVARATVTASLNIGVRKRLGGLMRLLGRMPWPRFQRTSPYVRFASSPMVQRGLSWMSPIPLPFFAPAAVIQREELLYTLIEWAAGEGPLMELVDGDPASLAAQAQRALATALRTNGIEDPAATLREIRRKTVENERNHPDQPAHIWRTNAILESADSDAAAKIHHGFDNTVARVSDGFSIESQGLVSVVSFALVVVMQIDAVYLLKRLSTDDKYRATLVGEAEALSKKGETLKAEIEKTPASGPAPQTVAIQDALKAEKTKVDIQIQNAEQTLALLRSPAIDIPNEVRWPSFAWNGWRQLPTVDFKVGEGKWPGILLAWVLLSLGAPYWYDTLKNALKLRSVLAKKDDAERDDRQKASGERAAAARPALQPATAVAQEAGDEAGDLAATEAAG